jgi:hypothetical protein
MAGVQTPMPALSALAGSGNFNLLRRTPGKVRLAQKLPNKTRTILCGFLDVRYCPHARILGAVTGSPKADSGEPDPR